MYNNVKILSQKKNDFIKKDKSELTKHVIAYIDFLGTTDKILSKTNDTLNFLKEIKFIYSITAQKYDEMRNTLNTILFDKVSKSTENIPREVNFKDIINPEIKYKIFSDNIILAIKIPEVEEFIVHSYTKDLLKKMIVICGQFQASAIFSGLLLRGGITVGDLYIDENLVYGSGLVDAYRLEESISIYPRIIIDNKLKRLLLSGESYIEDNDGLNFVDYYNYIGLANFIDEDSAIHLKNLLTRLKQQANNDKILQKVMWSINYHNNIFNSHSNEENYLKKYII